MKDFLNFAGFALLWLAIAAVPILAMILDHAIPGDPFAAAAAALFYLGFPCLLVGGFGVAMIEHAAEL